MRPGSRSCLREESANFAAKTCFGSWECDGAQGEGSSQCCSPVRQTVVDAEHGWPAFLDHVHIKLTELTTRSRSE